MGVKTLKTKKIKLSSISVFLILAVEILFFAMTADNFFSPSNLLSVGRQISMTGIAAVGMTILLLVGGIDISVGTMCAFSGVVCAKLVVEAQMPIPLSILITLCVGALCGSVNGFMCTHFKIPAMIGTMAMQTIAKGCAYLLTGGIPIYGLPESFRTLGQGYIGNVPVPMFIMIIVFILSFILLEKTYFGRHIYAVGGNQEAARLSGINTAKVQMICYIVCSVLASLAGIIMASRVNSGQPSVGVGFEMDAITASVLGGVSLMGGEGRLVNVAAGVLIMGILSNGMVMLDLTEYTQWVVKGVVLLFAVAVDNMQKGLVKKNA